MNKIELGAMCVFFAFVGLLLSYVEVDDEP